MARFLQEPLLFSRGYKASAASLSRCEGQASHLKGFPRNWCQETHWAPGKTSKGPSCPRFCQNGDQDARPFSVCKLVCGLPGHWRGPRLDFLPTGCGAGSVCPSSCAQWQLHCQDPVPHSPPPLGLKVDLLGHLVFPPIAGAYGLGWCGAGLGSESRQEEAPQNWKSNLGLWAFRSLEESQQRPSVKDAEDSAELPDDLQSH